jgi:hypothetical protein
MARPPVEWPIPTYVVEMRERVVAAYRVPAMRVAPLIPGPVAPSLVRGHGVVALGLWNGRCVKSVGGHPTLAGQFRVAEVFTPVHWQGACRPALRGNYLLRFAADSHGLSRLVRTALGFPAEHRPLRQGLERTGYLAESDGQRLLLPRTIREEPWPADSLFATHEDAEAALLHPEAIFVPTRDYAAVNAVPIHQYARATAHLRPIAQAAGILAETLDAAPEELVLDHVFFQKRCTHTWSFPPERIATVRHSGVQAFGRLGIWASEEDPSRRRLFLNA